MDVVHIILEERVRRSPVEHRLLPSSTQLLHHMLAILLINLLRAVALQHLIVLLELLFGG